MAYISWFYVARFIFYTLFNGKLNYAFDQIEQLGEMDTFLTSTFSFILAVNFSKAGIDIKRARKFLLIPPMILLSPAILVMFVTLFFGQSGAFINTVLNTADFLFLLYTISFSILIPIEILNNLKLPKYVYIYSLSAFVLGIVSLVVDNNMISNVLRTAPFIYGGYLSKKK